MNLVESSCIVSVQGGENALLVLRKGQTERSIDHFSLGHDDIDDEVEEKETRSTRLYVDPNSKAHSNRVTVNVQLDRERFVFGTSTSFSHSLSPPY